MKAFESKEAATEQIIHYGLSEAATEQIIHYGMWQQQQSRSFTMACDNPHQNSPQNYAS